MKKMLFPLVLVAFAAFMAGCDKERIEPLPVDPGTVTLRVERYPIDSTDAYPGLINYGWLWGHEEWEHPEVYINRDIYPVTLRYYQVENVVAADAYRAVFPVDIVQKGYDLGSSSKVPVTLPSEQHYYKTSDPLENFIVMPMGAYMKGNNGMLMFRNLCPLVCVKIKNSSAQHLYFQRLDMRAENTRLSGAGIATIEGFPTDGIELNADASHSVTVTTPEDEPVRAYASSYGFYYVVVPTFFSDKVTFTVTTTDGHCYEVSKDNVSAPGNTVTVIELDFADMTEIVSAELVD